MNLPDPQPGLVIRFSFLWSHEASAGAEEAAKDWPCTVIMAARSDPSGEIRTIVAPITHTPPNDPAAALALPSDACRALGLDGERQWLRYDELNRFTWPGYDLRPVPGKPGTYAYGMLPKHLYEKARRGILRLQQARRLRAVSRD